VQAPNLIVTILQVSQGRPNIEVVNCLSNHTSFHFAVGREEFFCIWVYMTPNTVDYLL